MSTCISSTRADGSPLFAVVAPSARFSGTPMVAGMRFAAFLRPFPDEVSAREALRLAGAVEEVSK